MIKSYYQKGKKQKRIVILGGIILILLLFFLRDDYQPALLFIRKYIFIFLLGIGFLWLIPYQYVVYAKFYEQVKAANA